MAPPDQKRTPRRRPKHGSSAGSCRSGENAYMAAQGRGIAVAVNNCRSAGNCRNGEKLQLSRLCGCLERNRWNQSFHQFRSIR
eukprot:12024079-Alexandrium_andersonii.AAC.1